MPLEPYRRRVIGSRHGFGSFQTVIYYFMYNLPRCSTMLVTARVRRVGNSLSIVIPAENARSEKISEGDVVQIEIQKKVNIQELFGSLKSTKSSQRAKDEARSGWGE